MNKKKPSALTLIVMLTIIMVTPIAFTNMANANFCFPPSNPDIIFTSPVNTTYTTNNVTLNVTISTYSTGYAGATDDASYRHLEYSVDGNGFHALNVTYVQVSNPGGPFRIDCLISLCQLSEGNHTLTVKADLDYSEYAHNLKDPSYLLHTKSVSTAYLIIDEVPDNTPTLIPTDSPIENAQSPSLELVIVVLAVVAAVVVSVSVYYLRIKNWNIWNPIKQLMLNQRRNETWQ